MKIKFKQGLAGPAYAYSAGDVADMEESQAIRLCEAGIAEPAKEKEVEKQTAPEVENQAITFDDLEKSDNGHYYLDGEHFAHGEENAREKLEKMSGVD